jgi:hypothetical protein
MIALEGRLETSMLKVYIISLISFMALQVSSMDTGFVGFNHVDEGSNLEYNSERLTNLVDTTKNSDRIYSDSKLGFNIMNLVKKNNTADLFVKVYTSKTTCFVGEPILATYKLYSRMNSTSTISRQPKLEGFRVFELFEIIPIASSTEIVNGIPYRVHTIKKAQLVPLQTGILQVDALELGSRVHYARGGTEGRDNTMQLDEMLNGLLKEESGPSRERLITVSSKPVHVKVNPLPGNGPAAFSGAVGRFNIKASLGSTSQVMNYVNILTIELSGSGYWSITEAPDILWPRDIESISIESTTEPGGDGNILDGKKVFKYSFVPKKAGKFIIPAISFTFFETTMARYSTIKTTPLHFESGLVKDISRTVQHGPIVIRANASNCSHPGHLLWWIALFISLLVVLGFAIKKRQVFRITSGGNDSCNESVKKTGVKLNSQSLLEDTLAEVRVLVDNTSNKEFYIALHSLLWTQLQHKLVLPQTVLNKAGVWEKLESFGWNRESIRKLDSILTELERIIYLPEYKTYADRRNLLDMAAIQIIQIKDLSNVPLLTV